ncbi:MAG: DUF2806 domain-containing protein [Aestuariivita sp.]|nr:DUF2806 domain-containing protein [Aestuariivita sp.]
MNNEITISKLRSIENRLHILNNALKELKENPGSDKSETKSEFKKISPDWFNYFEGYAEKATTEYVRSQWGKILAGEIRQPGSFSLLTLRILAELDQRTAEWFKEEVRFRITNSDILLPEKYGSELLIRMNALEQNGLLGHIIPAAGIFKYFEPGNEKIVLLPEGNLCFRVYTDKIIKLAVIELTNAGREIATILPPVDPMSMFEKLAEAFKGKAKSADVCKINKKEENQMFLSDPIRTFF